MRRSAAILALVLLTLSLVLGSAAVSAKPGGRNNENAKNCQGTGYLDWARQGDSSTAFTSEKECTSFAAQGGTLVPWVPLSSGCTALNGPGFDGAYIIGGIFDTNFTAGETISVTANPPRGVSGGAFSLRVDGVVVGSAFIPGTVTYTFPSNHQSNQNVTVIWLSVNSLATWTFSCGRDA